MSKLDPPSQDALETATRSAPTSVPIIEYTSPPPRSNAGLPTWQKVLSILLVGGAVLFLLLMFLFILALFFVGTRR